MIPALVCRLIAVILLVWDLAITSAYAQKFQTSRIFVCSNTIKANTDRCDEVSGPHNGLKRTAFPNKRIDFKLTVFGQGQAITYLRRNGFLPIKVGVWRDGFRRDSDISIDINQNDWNSHGDNLVADFNDSGQFRWRTFFYINVNEAQSISIEINDETGTIVEAAGDSARIAIDFSN